MVLVEVLGGSGVMTSSSQLQKDKNKQANKAKVNKRIFVRLILLETTKGGWSPTQIAFFSLTQLSASSSFHCISFFKHILT